MEWLRGRFVWAAVLIPLAGALAACEDQGPAEQTGEVIDETVEDTGDAIEDATD